MPLIEIETQRGKAEKKKKEEKLAKEKDNVENTRFKTRIEIGQMFNNYHHL